MPRTRRRRPVLFDHRNHRNHRNGAETDRRVTPPGGLHHPRRLAGSRRQARIAGALLAIALALAAGGGARAARAAEDAADAIARGDAAWSRRAEGHQGAHAGPGPIGEAITAYEQALKQQPERLEIYWKLLRAQHFKGEFVARTREEKQAVFGHGREVAEAGLDLLSRKAGGRERLDGMAPAAAAKALAAVPEAVALHLWAGIHWGLWGDNFGRLAAARQGVGDRMRRYCEVVIALDERYEYAGGHRLLGRLHTLAPKVPFLTGWIDRDKAVAELRRAEALSPEYPLNAVFLADALLQYQPGKAAEARQLLRREVERPPAADQVVEDEDAIAQARQLLAKGPG